MLRVIVGAMIGGVFFLHSAGILSVTPLVEGDRAAYDYAISNYPITHSNVNDVVILDIDEASLSHPDLGRWPWPRDVMTDLVTTLFENYQVKILAFDVVFAEPDKSSGIDTLNALAEGPLSGNKAYLDVLSAIAPKLDFDQMFSEVLMDYPVVLGYYFNLSDSLASKSGGLPLPAIFEDEYAIEGQTVTNANAFGGNIGVLTDAAIGAGHFNPVVDSDGLIRRVPLLIQFENDLYESLSLAIYRTYLGLSLGDGNGFSIPPISLYGETGELIEAENPGVLGSIEISGKRITVGPDASVYAAFQGPAKTFTYLSFADLMEGRISLEQLANKLVLVGTTAPGLSDFRATPVGSLYPGVEVHASVLASLLSANGNVVPVKPIEWRLLEPLLVVALSSVMIFLGGRLSPIKACMLWLLLFGSAVGAVVYAWGQLNMVLPVASLVSAITFIFAWNFGYQFFIEHRKRVQFTSLFGQYVPPELVQQMAEDPERYSMKGRRLPLSVMFSDVRGFTTISEGLSATELSEFINSYLTAMSQIIRDQGGTLDKYIGDAIMAFWGAPIDNERHALDAVKASLAMGAALGPLNEVCKQRGWPPVEIGIGINTGSMSVGDMGSTVRKAYTVMGDAVNLGSRLEGLTRNYGVLTIVSESTVKACPEVVFRELDLVTVKGKTEPVAIFEPIGLKESLLPEDFAELDSWHRMLSNYRAQKFADVTDAIKAMRANGQAKTVYDWIYDQAEMLIDNPPGPNWGGVTVFKTK